VPVSDDELGLFRMVQREMLAGFESIREELKRTREAVERVVLLQEDVLMRVDSLEQSAAKRRAGMRK
jgi:hypothetical protein